MVEYERGVKDKIISLKSRKFRKKHKRLFDLLGRFCSLFRRPIKNENLKKDNYKKSVNH